ncbi:MAG TPA: shikimate dehydrogenase [Actinomycetota bacterium]|nr:shikimate dehydrogenase [Actinomycetota bacterium]
MSDRLEPGWTGVLGWPLSQTLSPAIHRAAFEHHGLVWSYQAWPVEPTHLAKAVEGLRILGASGANVTMPHKASVGRFLDGLRGDAEILRAVNTIVPTDGGLYGYNTDAGGFKKFLTEDAGFDASGEHAVVLGAGGAARAVVKALTDLGVSAISIAARKPLQAAIVAELAAPADATVLRWEQASGAARGAAIVVNATPVGADGEEVLDGDRLNDSQVVVDLLYGIDTPLLQAARAAGAGAFDGLGMLVRQAAASFALWTDLDPPVEEMRAAAVAQIHKKPVEGLS